ncbi:MAG: hypothetical protein IT454_17860 [Planctomycetes bacterium]|nr:hypothetical protein [Planctomycetota bacterium]
MASAFGVLLGVLARPHLGLALCSAALALTSWAWRAEPRGQEAPLPVVSVQSANAMFAAEIRKAPGQEQVPDALARWRLSVYEHPRPARAEVLWSCAFPHRAGARAYLLADDGRSLVAVESEYSEARALVRRWRGDEELVELSATELDIDRSRFPKDTPKAWLAATPAALALEWSELPRGPGLALHVTTSYGESRYFDLESGAVTRAPASSTEPLVEPPASRVEKPGLRLALARKFQAPALAYWGEVLEVEVSGDHPTPNWMFVGFELALREGGQLVLSPISAPPPRNSVQAQVIQRFDAKARIQGLMPGRYTLRVEGCPDDLQQPLALEVRPARAFLELSRRGGFAGLDQSFRVYPSGVAVVGSVRPARPTEFRVLRRSTMQRLVDAAAQLKSDLRARPGSIVADGFEFRLAIWDGVRARQLEFQDQGSVGALHEIVELLTSGAL